MKHAPAPAVTRRRQSGFSMLELMAVLLILGTIILLVPALFSGFGARSRLEEGGNSLVSTISGVRQQAIIDGYETALQMGMFKDDDDEEIPGYRIRFTSLPNSAVVGEDREEQLNQRRQEEREWVYTSWRPLPDDVIWEGIAFSANSYRRPSKDRPIELICGADGAFKTAASIRLKSTALEENGVKRENHTITVTVNGLTSQASWDFGERDLPRRRDAAEFE